MAKKKNTSLNLQSLEKNLEKYFAKQAPQLPKSIKKAIVDFGPYLLALSVIFAVPSLITALGFSFRAYPVYYRAWQHNSWSIIISLVSLVSYGFCLAALPGLFKKSLKAWRLLFYSSLINLISPLIRLNLVSLVISAVVGWYILFQIKSSYK